MEAGMNWEEHAHLFANGKFKVKYDSGYEKLTRRIIGIRRTLRDWVLVESEIEGKEGACEIEYCTLIARKIEDMTDEEWISQLPDVLKDKADPQYIRQMETDKNSYLRSGRMLLYMLSIGVYPFDQSHFGETVIDIKTL